MLLSTADGPIFCSWSGGKDSALAFYHAKVRFGHLDYILTMFDEGCNATRAHGIGRELIAMQAESLGVGLVEGCASWNDYERVFLRILRTKFQHGLGVFGDIDLHEHLDWVVRVCLDAAVSVFEPLWQRPREKLIEEFLVLGFRARVVAVRKGLEDLLGVEVDRRFFEHLHRRGMDPFGEKGEYHTFVYDGPIFRFPLPAESVTLRVSEG